jgi:flagellar protein FliS
MMPNPYQQYQTMQVQTATAGDLVVMLYDAAIRALAQADAALNERRLDVAHARLTRAQDIVLELNNGVDTERGGELAQNLRQLYLYFFRTLVQANVRKDRETVQHVLALMNQLRGAWRSVVHGGEAPRQATALAGGRAA